LKLYEEQELTMQVFSEPDRLGTSEPPLLNLQVGFKSKVLKIFLNTLNFLQSDTQSNMYATLQPPPRTPRLSLGHSPGEISDYATLTRPVSYFD